LPFDELELGNLSFDLAVGPRLDHRRGDCILVGDKAFAEGREHAARAASVIQAGRAAASRSRTIRWKPSPKSRADTNAGTPLSMRATVIASPFVS
jgi:hypothetical protein